MDALKDPFEELIVEATVGDFEALRAKPTALATVPDAKVPAVATARLHGFDHDEQPLVTGLAELPGELVAARTAVPLVRAHIASTVVILFDRGDVRRPIIIGVVQESHAPASEALAAPQVGKDVIRHVSVQADDDRVVLSAEREIVLRCGEASITLTRAGKVLIKGKYVLSRSSGYNRIKGSAVDIN